MKPPLPRLLLFLAQHLTRRHAPRDKPHPVSTPHGAAHPALRHLRNLHRPHTEPGSPTPAQETALAHMRDRYPELANHTDPALEAFEALARVAAQTQHDPRSVDRTTQEHALRLVDLAKQDPRS